MLSLSLWNPASNAPPAENGTQPRWTSPPDAARATSRTARSVANRMSCASSTILRRRNSSSPPNWSERKTDLRPQTSDLKIPSRDFGPLAAPGSQLAEVRRLRSTYSPSHSARAIVSSSLVSQKGRTAMATGYGAGRMVAHNMVTTQFELNGFRVTRTLGVVRGIVVRSRSIFGTIGAGVQTLVGGNITLLTNLCEKTRQEAFDLMLQHAAELGGNAVVGARYDATEVMQGVTEVLAYGTAVFVEPMK